MQPVPAEKTACVRGVEIFAAGTYVIDPLTGESKTYTVADLADAVRNFQAFSQPNPPTPQGQAPILTCTVAIGHEEDQKHLERTDEPANGRVCRLWAQGPTLLSDWDRVPMELAAAINSHRYTKVSAEFYDNPQAAGCGAGTGVTFRRASVLGAEIPKVKGLKDIPVAMHSERALSKSTIRPSTCRRRGNTVTCFSEVDPAMDRDTLSKKLTGLGYSQAFIDTLSDEQLGALCTDAEQIMSGAPVPQAAPIASPPTPGGKMAESGMGDPSTGGSDQSMFSDPPAMPAAPGYPGGATPVTTQMADPAVAAVPPGPGQKPPVMACSDVSTAAAPAGYSGNGAADQKINVPPASAGAGATGAPPPMMSNPPDVKSPPEYRQPSQVSTVTKYSEASLTALERRQNLVDARIAASERHAAGRHQTEKRGRITRFCERMVNEGRVLPSELDASAGSQTLADQLLRADDTAVRKFSEKGKPVEKSELDLQMDAIERRPVLRTFSEQFREPEASAPAVSEARRVKLLSHSLLGKAALKAQAAKK
jgi:hypothetical protein